MNLTPRPPNDDHKRRLIAQAESLRLHFSRWKEIWPGQPISEPMLALYVEALNDLSPTEIDLGCTRALKVCTQFPKPAHIREGAAFECAARRPVGMGPRLLHYTDQMTPEERAECIADIGELRKKLQTQPETLRNADGTHTAKCLCQGCRGRRNSEPE